MVLLLGSVSLFLPVYALRKHTITPDEVIRLVSVVLIIAGTLLLITGGFSAQQIAPAMGLFGTIAGYVLGKAAAPTDKSQGDSK